MKNKIGPVFRRIGQILKQTFLHNWGTKFVCLVFAILFWHYAVLSLNTNRNVILSDVPVSVTSSTTLRARGFVLSRSVEDSVESVRVTVSTALSNAAALSKDRVTVTCDLSSINSAGTFTLPLQARTSYGTVAAIFPDSVTVEVEAMATRNLPIDPDLRGEPAEGCTLGDVDLSATTVTVTGPEALVSTLDSASAVLSVAGVEDTLRRSVPVTLLDKSGEEIASSLLTLSQRDVILTVPVRHTSTLPILAQDSVIGVNDIADGYEITSYEVYPESLQVQGPAAALDTLAEQGGLALSPVDVTGASSDVRTYTSAILPDGVSLAQNRSVLVIVRIQRRTTTLTLEDVPVEIRGVDPEEFNLRAAFSTVQATVTGPESQMANFVPSHLELYVDMSDRGAGTHSMPIHVLLDDLYEAKVTLDQPTLEVTLTAVPRKVDEEE